MAIIIGQTVNGENVYGMELRGRNYALTLQAPQLPPASGSGGVWVVIPENAFRCRVNIEMPGAGTAEIYTSNAPLHEILAGQYGTVQVATGATALGAIIDAPLSALLFVVPNDADMRIDLMATMF